MGPGISNPNGTVVWFRHDLRLDDNPALAAAVGRGGPVIPVFIQCDAEEGDWPPGAASRWWLHQSLASLDASLRARGSRLTLLRGPTCESLRAVIEQTGGTAVHWNRRYEPAGRERDSQVRTALRDNGVAAESFNGSLLCEPSDVQTQAGGPYRVFTPFKRYLLGRLDPPQPTAAPGQLQPPRVWPTTLQLDELALEPEIAWYATMTDTWTPGEPGAATRMSRFVSTSIPQYRQTREKPSIEGTSRLSPHLHFGELSIRRLWRSIASACEQQGISASQWRESTFVSELLWREFAHHLLYHFPHTPLEPLDRRFARWPWSTDHGRLRAWRRGGTGFPIVDAGMRELWATGWMHNRVRMIVASLLVKNLQIHWLEGARWFWDTLVDADLAANTLNWQWVAGCGADAAPYFRIFNPISQSQRFDPDGAYIRRWVPELAALPDKYIHAPWLAPKTVLAAANVRIGGSYPAPIVDLGESRAMALAAYQAVRDGRMRESDK